MQESHIKSTFPLFVRLLFGGFLAVGFLRLLNQQHQAAHPVVAGENKVYVDIGIFPTAEEVKEKYAI